jgi:hypothetical protein
MNNMERGFANAENMSPDIKSQTSISAHGVVAKDKMMRRGSKGRLLDAALTEAAAVALALFIYFGSGADGYLALFLLVAAGTLSIACIRILLGMGSKMHSEKVSKDELANWIYSALCRRRAGMHYTKAMAVAAEGIAYPPLKEKVVSALKRRMMHPGGADEAIIGDRRWAVGELRKNARRVESNRVATEESAQRYATFNMFISTILPSFMVFAFIGSSVLSRGSLSLSAFAAALLLGIPALYSLGNVLMWRRLLA